MQGGGRILPGDQEITCHSSQDHTMVTKFLDFIHKHPKYQVISLLSWQVFLKFSRDQAEIMVFWDRKSQNHFFFNFFITKSPNFISNLNDDCSQLSFEVYNVFVPQKLWISEFLMEFFFARISMSEIQACMYHVWIQHFTHNETQWPTAARRCAVGHLLISLNT